MRGKIVSGGAPLSIDLTIVRGKGGKGRLSENGLSFERWNEPVSLTAPKGAIDLAKLGG